MNDCRFCRILETICPYEHECSDCYIKNIVDDAREEAYRKEQEESRKE